MTPGVIHPLEIIDIENQKRKRIAIPASSTHLVSEDLVEIAPIENARDLVHIYITEKALEFRLRDQSHLAHGRKLSLEHLYLLGLLL